MKIIAAAIQAVARERDPEQVVGEAVDWVDSASGRGASLVVFPELFCPGFGVVAGLRRAAGANVIAELEARSIPTPPVEDRHGANLIDRLVDESAKRRITIVFTFLERARAAPTNNIQPAGSHSSSPTFFNSSVLITPRAGVVQLHRKSVLTPGMEAPYIEVGREFVVTATDVGKVGLLICAEATFSESFRYLTLQGAETICVSSADFFSDWRVADLDLAEVYWKHTSSAPCRAVENCVFVVAANAAGLQSGLHFFGGSKIISPGGDLLAEASAGRSARSEIICADLDFSQRIEIAKTFSLINRVPAWISQRVANHFLERELPKQTGG